MYAFLLLLAITTGCSTHEPPSSRPNAQKERIERHADDRYSVAPPTLQPPPHYPWESGRLGALPTITKEFFRCKGSALNPEIKVNEQGDIKGYFDCSGSHSHSLPLRNGKEWIPTILIDLLNYIQTTTSHRVVITSGHRCPTHNHYVAPHETCSKHMIGAEVDFFVQGLEQQPDLIVLLLQRYYRDATESKYVNFVRYEKSDTNVRTLPWYNKEIFIKLFQSDEGRNHDNRHPYPYISIQVRYDRERGEALRYDWNDAHRGYLKK